MSKVNHMILVGKIILGQYLSNKVSARTLMLTWQKNGLQFFNLRFRINLIVSLKHISKTNQNQNSPRNSVRESKFFF